MNLWWLTSGCFCLCCSSGSVVVYERAIDRRPIRRLGQTIVSVGNCILHLCPHTSNETQSMVRPAAMIRKRVFGCLENYLTKSISHFVLCCCFQVVFCHDICVRRIFRHLFCDICVYRRRHGCAREEYGVWTCKGDLVDLL